MEISRGLTAEQEDKRYTMQYDRLHVDTLELKIKEKDKLLLELSGVNQEIYKEISNSHAKLQLSREERDLLLKENLNLKDQIIEKASYIKHQEQLVNKLRQQLSESTNGNSLDFQERLNKNDSFLSQLKELQDKYDKREDLVISLQEERVNLLNTIDYTRKLAEIAEEICKELETAPEIVLEKVRKLKGGSYFPQNYRELVSQICSKLNCDDFEHIVPMITSMNFTINAYQNTIAKTKQYFHLHPTTTLEELDRYVKNLLL